MSNTKKETIEDYGLFELQVQEVHLPEKSDNCTKFRPDFTVEDFAYDEVDFSSSNLKLIN